VGLVHDEVGRPGAPLGTIVLLLDLRLDEVGKGQDYIGEHDERHFETP
jgi:hypothetical protein